MKLYFVINISTRDKLRVFADEQTAQRFSDAWNKHNDAQHQTRVIGQ